MMANYQVRFGGRFTGVLSETSRFRPYSPIPSDGNGTFSATTPTSSAIKSESIQFRGSYPLLDGRCVMNAFKGMNGTPTSC